VFPIQLLFALSDSWIIGRYLGPNRIRVLLTAATLPASVIQLRKKCNLCFNGEIEASIADGSRSR
jgi:hypothetical protein